MFCSKCGAEIMKDNLYCGKCGEKIVTSCSYDKNHQQVNNNYQSTEETNETLDNIEFTTNGTIECRIESPVNDLPHKNIDTKKGDEQTQKASKVYKKNNIVYDFFGSLVSAVLFGAILAGLFNWIAGSDDFFDLFIMFSIIGLVIFFVSSRDNNKDNKRLALSSYDINALWKQYNYELDILAEFLSNKTNVEEKFCRSYIINQLITKGEVKSALEKTKYDKNFVLNEFVSNTHLPKNDIQAIISEIINEKELLDRRYQSSNIQQTSPKQQYKANKKAGIVSCPKCGSTSISTTNKKISATKGVAGAAVGSLINPVGTVVGAAVGATHSKKIYNVCMNCGHKWKP